MNRVSRCSSRCQGRFTARSKDRRLDYIRRQGVRVCVGGGGGGVLPYISHSGMCRPKGWGQVLRRFGLKTGIDFAHFGLCMNVFVISIPNE